MGDFETVKQSVSLHDFAEQFLDKSRGGMWCCPACGSGAHGTRNSDGALSITRDGNHWQCFSCSAQGDIFDLAGIVWNIAEDDKRGRLEAVADWAGVQIGRASNRGGGNQGAPQRSRKAKPAEDFTEGRRKEAAYIESMRANIEHPEAVAYLAARGFTIEDAKAEGLGYDPKQRRIVIPWPGVDWYHANRAISEEQSPKYKNPKGDNLGAQPIYNLPAAKEDSFLIVEGILDAVAIRLCGCNAVIALATNHIGGQRVTELTEAMPKGVFAGVAILMLDNDEHGADGTEAVRAALDEAGIAYTVADVREFPYKDAAEWYQADKRGLRAFIEAERNRARATAAEAKEQAYRAAMSRFRVLDPASVATDIFTLTDFEEPTETGIAALDDILDGGLRSGLYALGAVSSMGKTTLAVQVADYIAERGRGVLFVTIEQSAREITSKSLSRLTRTLSGGYNVVTSTEALSASRRERWGDKQAAAFLKACEYYAARIAPRLRILEGTKQPSVSDVEIVARMMAEHDGKPPVIFIDYLQLLAASSERDTDKQAIDKNVMLLRQLARDMKTPIWVISSLNRSSYSEGVTMDSFKESGAIEYGCDVLLGLQPQGMRDKLEKVAEGKQRRTADNELRKHKAGYERACELVILKNRNGRTPDDGIPLTFKPLSALYTEGEQEKSGGLNIM